MSIPARHICASPYHKGPRWQLACFFYRNRRHRTGLQSYCITCTKIHMRAENLSDHVKEYRKNYTREYKAKQRRAKGIPARGPQLLNPKFDSKKLIDYLEQRITTVEIKVDKGSRKKTTTSVLHLNGVQMEQADQRYYLRLKHGEVERASLARIDELATRYDLPLWELAEAAGRYKKDVRSKRPKRLPD